MTLHSRICFTKHTEHMPITLYEKTCLSVCRRRQCPTERSDLLGTERCDLLSKVARKHRLGLCSTYKKSKFLQSAKQELTNTNFKPLSTEEVYENYVKLLNLTKKNFITLELKKFNNEINSFFKENYCSKNLDFLEAHQRSLTEMEELRKFQSSTFDTIARRKLTEDQNTILELSGRVKELQNEVIV